MPVAKKVRDCPEGKELKPSTGRCVKKCKPNRVREPITFRCIKNPKNHIINPITGRQVKRGYYHGVEKAQARILQAVVRRRITNGKPSSKTPEEYKRMSPASRHYTSSSASQASSSSSLPYEYKSSSLQYKWRSTDSTPSPRYKAKLRESLAELRKTGQSVWLSRQLPYNVREVTKIEAERKWRELRKKIANGIQQDLSVRHSTHSSQHSQASQASAKSNSSSLLGSPFRSSRASLSSASAASRSLSASQSSSRSAAHSVSSPRHIMKFMDGKRKGEIVKIKKQH